MSIDLRIIGRIFKTTAPDKNSAGTAVKHSEPSRFARPGPDAVQLTDASAILQNAERLVAAMPVVDMNRVSAITASLVQGNYIVDTERVAEKIIEFEHGLPD